MENFRFNLNLQEGVLGGLFSYSVASNPDKLNICKFKVVLFTIVLEKVCYINRIDKNFLRSIFENKTHYFVRISGNFSFVRIIVYKFLWASYINDETYHTSLGLQWKWRYCISMKNRNWRYRISKN